jgi:predicted nucleic acid-binding protein
LRLATNRKVFGTDALTLPEARQKYDILQSDPCVSYIDEPAGLELRWRSLTQQQSYSPSIWTDAYSAAFAKGANLELVTFDTAFLDPRG